MATPKKSKKKNTVKSAPPKPKAKRERVPTPQAPRGTQDILPSEQKYWEYVVETAKTVARGFGWQRIDTPIFEETALFVRGIGEETDIVSKELYELKSRGSTPYSLRPEHTAPVARAYIEHGLRSWPKPVKLFYTGPVFRYERPQKGRLRQHHQFGLEVFGSNKYITDVQVIYVIHALFQELGLEDYTVKINSLGEPSERKEYIKLLKEHYRRNRSKMCQTCKERLKKNPLRVLDCKEEKCQQLSNTAPRLLDHLDDASRTHFEEVLSSLDELKVPYDVAPGLVRGLDYYTHTVFEFVPKKKTEEAQSALAAGGRYDNLLRSLGHKSTAAVGAAFGIERVIEQLKEEGVELTLADSPQIFIAHLGEQAKREAINLSHDLQKAGLPFSESVDRDGMQIQLQIADRQNIQWVLIVGHKEVLDNTVILRNMASGMQEVIPRAELIDELNRRLGIEA